MPLLVIGPKLFQDVAASTFDVALAGGARTTVHIVRYDRRQFKPRLVRFDRATRLLDWCQQNEIQEAITGGHFNRTHNNPQGELWINGRVQDHTPFMQPWASIRGSLYIDEHNRTIIESRAKLPERPAGDLLQTGPVLVKNGKSQIIDDKEFEGISAGAHEYDDDISDGRFPRSAIGLSDKYIWSIACDGSSYLRTGLSFSELAELIIMLGADSALNLDGGGSSTQISGGKLRNRPYGDHQYYPRGRPLYSAIVFERF